MKLTQPYTLDMESLQQVWIILLCYRGFHYMRD